MIKVLLSRIASLLGYSIVRNVPPPLNAVDPRISALVSALRPIKTDIPLLRVGGDSDGAYLIPDDFDGICALFSPGVDKVAKFEAEMAEHGMICYLADASVASPPEDNWRFRFESKFLGIVPKVGYESLDNWIERLEPGDHDLMLQMDIEGAEWLVLANATSRLLNRFRIMVIEFHSLSRMFDDFGAQIMPDVFERLLHTHNVVHVHPNNVSYVTSKSGVDLPELIEVTLLRKDRGKILGFASIFPHPLDIINVPEREVLALPHSWYSE